MHVTILDKHAALKVAEIFPKPFAVISISTPGDEPPKFPNNKLLKYLLPLSFYDIDPASWETSELEIYKNGIFSEKQAKQIIEFVYKIEEVEIDTMLIHCDAGVSRSAGVGAAVELIMNGSDKTVFNNRKFVPNRFVYRTIINTFHKMRYCYNL